MKLTKKAAIYLDKKLLGGAINEKGNKYESYFTVHQIVTNANLFPNSTSTIFISSQENSFVDDLLVDNSSFRYLYQLKTSKKLSWSLARIMKTINFDFSIQRRIEIFYKRKFELGLVVSYSTLEANLKKSLPKHLSSCTKIIYFPYHDSLPKQIINDSAFRLELEKLSGLTTPTTDKLESLAACILGFWSSTNKKKISLKSILSKVESLGYSFIKPRVIHKLSPATLTILDKIPDFKYIEANGYLTWKYKTTDSGTIQYQIGSAEFNRIESDIQINNPADFSELEKLLL